VCGALSSHGFESNLVGFEGSVLSGNHDSESVKIGGLGSLCESRHLFGSGLSSPFLIEFIGSGQLLQSTSSASSEDSWNTKLCELKSLDWIKDSWEASASIDLYSVNINHINNDDHFAVVFTKVDVGNSTCLNEISYAHLNNFILNNNILTQTHSFYITMQ